MNSVVETLFALIQIELGIYESISLPTLSEDEWRDLCRLAAKSGVLAITFDGFEKALEQGIIDESSKPSSRLQIQWMCNVDAIEKRYYNQYFAAKDFADLMAEHNISTVVLKGMSVGAYYTKPEHRPCGDLDCFLPNNFVAGNIIAQQAGAKVDKGYYKHSHIIYKGLLIENHQFCIDMRGSDKLKEFERMLQSLILSNHTKPIGDSRLLSPNFEFTGYFLLHHSLTHFLAEGISLRHILDWALWLSHEQNRVDWIAFYKVCDYYDLRRFADLLTTFVAKYFNIKLHSSLSCASPYACLLLDDIICSAHSKNPKNAWLFRLKKFRTLISRRKWYNYVGNVSSGIRLKQVLTGIIFEHKVSL